MQAEVTDELIQPLSSPEDPAEEPAAAPAPPTRRVSFKTPTKPDPEHSTAVVNPAGAELHPEAVPEQHQVCSRKLKPHSWQSLNFDKLLSVLWQDEGSARRADEESIRKPRSRRRGLYRLVATVLAGRQPTAAGGLSWLCSQALS